MADIYHICYVCNRLAWIEKNRFEGISERIKDALCEECLEKIANDLLSCLEMQKWEQKGRKSLFAKIVGIGLN